MLVPLLIVGGLAFVIDSVALYLVLEISLVVLLFWAAAASWVVGHHRSTS